MAALSRWSVMIAVLGALAVAMHPPAVGLPGTALLPRAARAPGPGPARADSPDNLQQRPEVFLPIGLLGVRSGEVAPTPPPTATPADSATPAATSTSTASLTPTATRPPAWPSPTNPPPTWTPLPTPTGSAGGLSPPPALMVLPDGVMYWSGIGTFCWRPGGFCVDYDGIVTPLARLRSRSPFVAHLLIQPPEGPKTLTMTVYKVVPEEEEVTPIGRIWRPTERTNPYELLPQREQDIQIARRPGLYVIEVFTTWPTLGDADYGFLLEIVP